MSPLQSLGISPESERVLFSTFSQGVRIQSPFSLIHQAFEHKVDTQPDDVAVEHDNSLVTYSELEKTANRMANHLIQNGLRPSQKVCLVVQRSISMVVGMLAILKCGCQYVPLDGGVTPELLLSHIIENTGTSFVLCVDKYQAKAKKCSTTQSILILDRPEQLDESTSRPTVDLLCSSGAYVIYTSGTTGKPKGVAVTHENVTNLLCLSPGNLGITRGVCVTQILSVSFDMGQWEILGTLMNGGTLLLRTSNWGLVLKRAHTVISTPSILATMTRSEYPNIRTVALAGEPCPKLLADDWSQDVALYNCCGPTEVTIVNTMKLHKPGQPLSIGPPNPNTNVYILDDYDNPLPIGQVGVMWAGGKCVSRGYVGMPELTSKKFKYDKFTNDGSLMFNTGDLGRWLPDGTLEHRGRTDDQVKIKGFRVELDGISAAIEKAPGVTRACAIHHENVLWGFYSGISYIDEVFLKDVTSNHQPYYAIPTKWVFKSSLPLTSNGKTDRRALTNDIAELSSTKASSEKLSAENVMDPTIPEKCLIQTVTDVSAPESSISSSNNSLKEVDYSLPEKEGTHGLRALRHRIFSLYRRFFSLVFIANISTLIVILTSPQIRRLEYIATAIASNLTASVLFRQEHVVNLLFWLACSVPVSAPLWIRRQCAKVYHIGGLHSGFAVASVIWLVAFTVVATIERASPAVLTITYMLDCLLLAICALAHPTFRAKSHDHFELTHRFAGWTSLALFWVQTILSANDARIASHQTLSYVLLRTPGVWLLTVATFSVALPWLKLRKVPVTSEVLSSHAVRLHFNYTTPIVGTAVRISDRPLLEWHAFATISKPAFPSLSTSNEFSRNDGKGFSLLVSNAGDWTKHQIETAPRSLYIRGVPACGVLRIAPLFKSIVLVATGSGIGPCLPVIYRSALTFLTRNSPNAPRHIPLRIFWSTPNPLATFGQEIQDAIYAADPKAVIHDTRTMGRPDMVRVSWRLLIESGAEAVCVIANKKLTQRVVYGVESRGRCAYGAIFDS
ncbi:hypothetical protein BJ875DRAFT_497659 [Amylocarpus encephaloides]|uniref:AMP-dependent synthetase/ligase domain-containing protein n=1 Tax=Amylocarpus encephaloides TaxID=45428 RepID=A0A9P7YE73_9HELO|nr:hypothetical protein BJ875DRAFT_497659 [Amylocarpus encephaloides]